MRNLLIFWTLLIALQGGTGILLFGYRIGFAPENIIEYYGGSEALLKSYPHAKDRFMPAKTFTGLWKAVHMHGLAYPLFVFLIYHLFYLFHPRREQFTSVYLWGMMAALVFGMADFLSGFLAIQGSPVFATIRLISFLGFASALLFSIYLLLMLIYDFNKTRNSARD